MHSSDDCRLLTRRAEREDTRDRASAAAAAAVRAAVHSGVRLPPQPRVRRSAPAGK